MQIAQHAIVGLEVVAALARRSIEAPGRPTPLATLGAMPGVEPTFVHYVLRHLRIAGLVTSKRGAEGGWSLTRPPETISVAEVVIALDGPLVAIEGSVSGTPIGTAADRLLATLRGSVRDVLDAVSIADLAGDASPTSVPQLTAAAARRAG